MVGRIDKAIAVGRDLFLFVFGCAGIAYQQLTGDVNFVLLAIFTAMTGVPGVTHLISLSRGMPRGSPTNAPSSPQASEPPPSVSDNS